MAGFLLPGLYKMVISWRLPENNRKGSQLFSNIQEKKRFICNLLEKCMLY